MADRIISQNIGNNSHSKQNPTNINQTGCSWDDWVDSYHSTNLGNHPQLAPPPGIFWDVPAVVSTWWSQYNNGTIPYVFPGSAYAFNLSDISGCQYLFNRMSQARYLATIPPNQQGATHPGTPYYNMLGDFWQELLQKCNCGGIIDNSGVFNSVGDYIDTSTHGIGDSADLVDLSPAGVSCTKDNFEASFRIMDIERGTMSNPNYDVNTYGNQLQIHQTTNADWNHFLNGYTVGSWGASHNIFNVGDHYIGCEFLRFRVYYFQLRIASAQQQTDPNFDMAYHVAFNQAAVDAYQRLLEKCDCKNEENNIQARRGVGIINKFDLDFSDLPATSERRTFTIFGQNEPEFRLEVKDKDTGKYYNFQTQEFQTAEASLEETVRNGNYRGQIVFPAITGSTDQYDIYLYAGKDSKHRDYVEKRFDDGSIDINSSLGSKSLLVQKVIYQYPALAAVTTSSKLTLSGYSPNGTVSGTMGTAVIGVDRGKSIGPTAFSCTVTAATTAAYRVLRQPIPDDILAFVEPTIGAAPILLPGENEYPTARLEFIGNDVNGAVTSGSVVRMDATDLSAVIEVGDKITSPITTDTVDGAVSTASKVVMDNNVATKMAVGDRVTLTTDSALANLKYFELNVVVVAALDPDGDNAKEFSMTLGTPSGDPASVTISDGATLSFSSKVNESLTTVTVVETSGTATDFTMSQAIQFRDNQPLTFTPRMNYSWPVNNFAHLLKEDMIVVPGGNVVADSTISVYEDVVTLFEGTKKEERVVKNKVEPVGTLGKKPTITKGLISTQEGQIVFNKQQPIALADDTLKIGGYGEDEIERVYGWKVKFTDLAVTLTAPTTTTTEVSAGGSSADIAVTSREGVINNVSRVGGIGINPALQNPLITSGGGATGGGDWTMDAVQTLENGITLTIENTSRVATITGNIEVLEAGTSDQTLRFDIEKLLSTSA